MKILIAADGSEFSKAAVEFCRNIIADPANTSFKVISAFELPLILPSDPTLEGSPDFYDQLEEAGHAGAAAYAEDAADQLRLLFPQSRLDLTSEVIQDAPPRAIIEAAESWNADLIVIGSHAYGFWRRMMLGSVSDAVLNHAPCSVLVVRGKDSLSKELT
ncbi:MAG TPA: universal stress protein [Pyrinomonadaceae bacterium]|jgi:nucleotide-binding universal stress UspA family protein